MSYGLHVIEFPSGRFGYVGSLPTCLAEPMPASTAAVLGCRAWRDSAGKLMEWKFPTFATLESAIAFANSKGLAPMVGNVPQHP